MMCTMLEQTLQTWEERQSGSLTNPPVPLQLLLSLQQPSAHTILPGTQLPTTLSRQAHLGQLHLSYTPRCSLNLPSLTSWPSSGPHRIQFCTASGHLAFSFHQSGVSGKEPCLPVQETQETLVWSLGGEDPLGKGMTTHSSILAWRISWTEEPGQL